MTLRIQISQQKNMVKYYCKDNIFEKMKLTALVILLSFSLKISGQQIIHPSNHYRNGDVQEKKQVIVEGFDLSGKNGVWSLEDAEISKKSFSTEYTAEVDTMMMLERGNRTYLHQGNGIVRIIGSENAQELISYDMPETWRDVTGLSPDIHYEHSRKNFYISIKH